MENTLSDNDEIEQKPFFAVCNDCGSVKDESYDHKQCDCGGIFHVDSARCITCGKRHHFDQVGKACSCKDKGMIVANMVSCPVCKKNKTIDHLGEHCASCKVQLRMEG